ncbi:sulfur carrier protein ThiS [Arthrobacter mobilis]|uniref:Sulfur carrier protein ThiS n=1 Tax=Arthrobacter mobilis TaxID=2724944 RepID=A0A7X6HES5_9MICC|nr:sulfur carrier protein ThiS [Arthrobacter mobilis]NKX54843.1 sulfur carrier protein ThiS [Arthrobacter mobilis]
MTAINLNGSRRPLAAGQTLTDLVAEVTGRQFTADGLPADGARLGVAVARNSEVVPRRSWSATVLAEGDDIEILNAVQGG